MGYGSYCWRTLETEGKALGRAFKVGHIGMSGPRCNFPRLQSWKTAYNCNADLLSTTCHIMLYQLGLPMSVLLEQTQVSGFILFLTFLRLNRRVKMFPHPTSAALNAPEFLEFVFFSFFAANYNRHCEHQTTTRERVSNNPAFDPMMSRSSDNIRLRFPKSCSLDLWESLQLMRHSPKHRPRSH